MERVNANELDRSLFGIFASGVTSLVLPNLNYKDARQYEMSINGKGNFIAVMKRQERHGTGTRKRVGSYLYALDIRENNEGAFI